MSTVSHRSLTTMSSDSSALITLDEAKNWLRVVGTDEDSLIQALIRSAVSYSENFLNKTIGENTYILSLDEFSDIIDLDRPPVEEVTKIEYIDPEGDVAEYDVANVVLDKPTGRMFLIKDAVYPEIHPQPFGIKIHYTCNGMYETQEGYDVLDAIKMVLTYHYEFRDDVNQRWRKASDNILRPLRIIPFG